MVDADPDGREAAFDIHTSWVTPDNFPGYVEQEVQFRFDNGVWNAHQRKRGVELTVEGRTPLDLKITPNHHYNAAFVEPWGDRVQRGYGLEVIRRFFEEVAFVEFGGARGKVAAVCTDKPSESAWYDAWVGLVDIDERSVEKIHAPQWQLQAPRILPEGRVAWIEGFSSDRGVATGTGVILVSLLLGTGLSGPAVLVSDSVAFERPGLAVQDGAELMPTFSWPRDRLLLLIAGGEEAMVRAVEGAEDESEHGAAEVRRNKLDVSDVLIAVAAVAEDEVAGQQGERQPAAPALEASRVGRGGYGRVVQGCARHFFSVSSKKSIVAVMLWRSFSPRQPCPSPTTGSTRAETPAR